MERTEYHRYLSCTEKKMTELHNTFPQLLSLNRDRQQAKQINEFLSTISLAASTHLNPLNPLGQVNSPLSMHVHHPSPPSWSSSCLSN